MRLLESRRRQSSRINKFIREQCTVPGNNTLAVCIADKSMSTNHVPCGRLSSPPPHVASVEKKKPYKPQLIEIISQSGGRGNFPTQNRESTEVKYYSFLEVLA